MSKVKFAEEVMSVVAKTQKSIKKIEETANTEVINADLVKTKKALAYDEIVNSARKNRKKKS